MSIITVCPHCGHQEIVEKPGIVQCSYSRMSM